MMSPSRDSVLPDSADAVVIGGGAMGLSIAYHLAARGRHVVLIEKDAIASQNSKRAAGLFAQMLSTETMTRLSRRSIALIKAWSERDDFDLPYVISGSIKIARLPQHATQLEREVAASATRGVEMHAITPREAHERLPYFNPTGVLGITYTPGDIYLEPEHLIGAYETLLSALGVVVAPNTAAFEIRIEAGAVAAVVTSAGTIATPCVVDAAGAWLHAVGAFGGTPLTAVPTRHQLLITQPLPSVAPDQPIARIIDANTYIRPARGGLMLGGYEANPLQLAQGAPAPDFVMDDLELDIAVLRRFAEAIHEQFPIFGDVSEVAVHRGGLPTMTTDGELIVGGVDAVRGFFVAGGCCVSGLSVSPAIGELIAECVIDGAPSLNIDALSPNRPAVLRALDASAIAASRRAYAYRYWSDPPAAP